MTASIVGSTAVYERQVGFVHGGTLRGLLEIVLVLVPLAYHAAYGVYVIVTRRTAAEAGGVGEARDHGYATDLMRALQRASGAVVLCFSVGHILEFRGQTWANGLEAEAYATRLIEHLSSTQYGVPFIAIGYVLGMAAISFHLANGLSSFVVTWGYATLPRAERRARVFFRVTGGLLFALSTAIVIQVATGARLFPASAKPPALCGSADLPAFPPRPSAPGSLPAAPP